ncbi:MAG: inositol monophosphatase [Phycisphaerae bacterium]
MEVLIIMLENQDLSRLLETAIVAARLAGQRAMEELDYAKVSIKNETDLVTQADKICQQIIIDRIKETYPDHGFIAEEGKDGNFLKQTPRGDQPIWWAVDPIDGTNNYAHKLPLFSVSIAAIYEGKPVVGVIFDPATDSMFTAFDQGEAQLNGRRIQASEEKIGRFSSIALDSHFEKELPNWAQQMMQRTRFRVIGTSCLQFTYTAKGSLIATVLVQPKLWDIAAGVLICERAAAVVTDWSGNPLFPMDIDNYAGRTFNILAANKTVHGELLGLLTSK